MFSCQRIIHPAQVIRRLGVLHSTTRDLHCVRCFPYRIRRGQRASFSAVTDDHFQEARIPRFRLRDDFVARYKNLKPPFGFNGLGELVYVRTYARLKENGVRENWVDTVERVVNGTFEMQETWMQSMGLDWDEDWAHSTAEEMFDRIFHMKFMPPGRGLWAMGTELTRKRGLFAALNNCAFVSTEDIDKDPTGPFTFLMDASMLGVGVGFDTCGANKLSVRKPSLPQFTFTVPDSREGWVESLSLLLDSYFRHPGRSVQFDYSLIRPAGTPIKGFGGVAQGPQILEDLHNDLRKILDGCDGKLLTITAIVDIMNLVGKCVVAGNVRRTAEIAFGDPDSDEYIALKDYSVNPSRASHGWLSNNSVFAKIGMNYSNVCEKVNLNGEPGFAWLENMRKYGRMGDPQNNRDSRAKGGNPCLEQTLESYEMCCLVETFPCAHSDLRDYLRTLELAFLYAKTVTLGRTHWPRSNAVMLRNRRIGVSMSGIAQFISSRGISVLHDWSEQGYQSLLRFDTVISEKFAIPTSVKMTCVKPSGTVSLLAGATPGMHWPEAQHYIRRVRLARTSDLLPPLRAAGYPVEEAAGDKSTVVVEVPVQVEGVRTLGEVSMWEQLGLAALLQRVWADNQVSCTVTFDPETEGSQLQHALNLYQYQLKGISFLPRLPKGAYAQMPYEEISKVEYQSRVSQLHSPNFTTSGLSHANDEVPDKFCDAAGCGIEDKTH